MSRRDALRASVAAPCLALATAAGCSAPRPARSGVLQLVGPWEIAGLSAVSSGYIFARLGICETLMGAAEDGSPAAELAEAWSVSVDGLTWTFSIRSGATFHDGSPVTAAAVIACLETARTPPAVLSLAPIAAIREGEGGEVQIVLDRPFALVPALLAHSSTLILAPASFDAAGGVQAVIGTGPYRVRQLIPPQEVEIEAVAPADPSSIAAVHYLAAGRAETRTLMALGQQSDIAYNLDPPSLARLRKDPDLRIESVPLPRTVILKINSGLPRLADVRVRRALSSLLDRTGIASALMRDPETAATQLLSPALPVWHDPSLKPLTFDPDQAAALLAEAGWTIRGGALVDATGDRFRLELRTFPDRPELPMIATAIQAQWREAGIDVAVSIGNSGDIPLGHRDGTLEVGLAARNFANVADPTIALIQDFGPRGGDWGAMGWSDPEVIAALDALAEGGLDAAEATLRRSGIVARLQDELPVIPVLWYRQHVAVSPRIEGVSLDPLERSYRLDRVYWR